MNIAYRIAVVWLGTLILTGCQKPSVSEFIRAPGMDAMSYYVTSYQHYATTLSEGLTGSEYVDGMKKSVTEMNAAIHTASAVEDGFVCPLFRSRLAEIYLSLDPKGSLDEAYRLWEASVSEPRGCPEWIPGWIGLAEWASASIPTDNNKAADAEYYLAEAEGQLEDLMTASKGRPMTLFGSDATGEAADQDLNDPTLSEGRRTELLWNWLLQNETWDDPQFKALGMGGGTDNASIKTDALYRRLKARIYYQRVAVQVRLGEPSEVVLRNLGNVLEWDTEYFPARLEVAAQKRLQGDHSQQEAWLIQRLRRGNSHYLFGSNARFWLELARAYVAWHRQDPTAEICNLTDTAFVHLLRNLDPDSPEGNLDYARFCVQATRSHADQPLNVRLGWLEEGREHADRAASNGCDKGAVEKVLNDLHRLRGELQG